MNWLNAYFIFIEILLILHHFDLRISTNLKLYILLYTFQVSYHNNLLWIVAAKLILKYNVLYLLLFE
jgi:hypothetical protein